MAPLKKTSSQKTRAKPLRMQVYLYGFAVLFNAMDGKDVLGKIDSSSDNAHGFPFSSFVEWMT